MPFAIRMQPLQMQISGETELHDVNAKLELTDQELGIWTLTVHMDDVSLGEPLKLTNPGYPPVKSASIEVIRRAHEALGIDPQFIRSSSLPDWGPYV